MKSWKFYVLSVVLAFSLAGAGLQAATITKGLIGTQDINLTQTQAGAAETFGRSSSTGTTLTLNKLEGNSIPWSSAYTRTILPLHITGDGSTSALTNFLSLTSTNITSSGTAALAVATVSSTLGVTGTGTFSGSLVSDSLTSGAGTFSGNIAANGNIVGDDSTQATNMALVSTAALDIDSKTFDTGTAAPTSGTYVAGDIVFNSAPTSRGVIAATGALFWRCITGGTPGTWQAVFPVFTVAPDNAAMTATQGMIAIDNTYIHIAINDNEWERVAVATW